MIWWFLILGLSTLAVVGAAIALYMRVRQHMRHSGAESESPSGQDVEPHGSNREL